MILSAKKLTKMAKKWQKLAAMAAMRRKRISYPMSNHHDGNSCSTSSFVVDKGHFVVYTADQKRFVIPLAYLQNEVIIQLLNMSENAFGLSNDGPITLPCDTAFMNYIVMLIKRGVSVDLQNALLVSVATRCSSGPFPREQRNTQLLVY